MRSTNEKKPINVLTEFITNWVRENSGESLPFDSFETIRSKRIEQKDVERWIFNCNYLYYRFGDLLYENDLLPAASADVAPFLSLLDANFKTIKDSNPLNLRSKQNDAIMSEFAKDWPPFTHGSRNKLAKLDNALQAYGDAHPEQLSSHARAFDAFGRAMADEARFYADLSDRCGEDPAGILEQCRTLLPVWTLKEVNPLYSLLLWSDEQAISELCKKMVAAFEGAQLPSFDGSYKHDSYTGLVKRAQRSYLDNLDDSGDELSKRPVREIARLLDREFFSLDRPAPSKTIPAWLHGKAQLIWNVVICAVFGPKAALTGAHPIRTSTVVNRRLDLAGESPEVMRGEVLLRRHYRTGRLETVDRLVIDDVQSSGLWKVIGSNYDENTALPQSDFRDQYKNLGVLFVGSQRFDAAGNIVEGEGDSRFHAEISVRIGSDGEKRLVLHDLNSKNGTHVLRQDGGQVLCLALQGRQRLKEDEWKKRSGIPGCVVSIVPNVTLRRGDLIQLCGSCFEII